MASSADPDGALPIREDGADRVEGETVAAVEGAPASTVPAGDTGIGLGKEVTVGVFCESQETCSGIGREAVGGDVAGGEASSVGSENADVLGAAGPEPAVAVEEEIGPGRVAEVLLGAEYGELAVFDAADVMAATKPERAVGGRHDAVELRQLGVGVGLLRSEVGSGRPRLLRGGLLDLYEGAPIEEEDASGIEGCEALDGSELHGVGAGGDGLEAGAIVVVKVVVGRGPETA